MVLRDTGYWVRHPDRAAVRIAYLEELINRWQGMLQRQVMNVSAKCTKEMQIALKGQKGNDERTGNT